MQHAEQSGLETEPISRRTIILTASAIAALAAVGVQSGPGAGGAAAVGFWGYPNGNIPTSAMTLVDGKYLRADAAASLQSMASAYRSATGRYLTFNEGYRDLATQWVYWNRYQAGGNVAAYPGSSNHGWALAVDFDIDDTVFNWLQSNAARFGWDWTTGRNSGERWHWEYILDGGAPAQNVFASLSDADQQQLLMFMRNVAGFLYAGGASVDSGIVGRDFAPKTLMARLDNLEAAVFYGGTSMQDDNKSISRSLAEINSSLP